MLFFFKALWSLVLLKIRLRTILFSILFLNEQYFCYLWCVSRWINFPTSEKDIMQVEHTLQDCLDQMSNWYDSDSLVSFKSKDNAH